MMGKSVSRFRTLSVASCHIEDVERFMASYKGILFLKLRFQNFILSISCLLKCLGVDKCVYCLMSRTFAVQADANLENVMDQVSDFDRQKPRFQWQ